MKVALDTNILVYAEGVNGAEKRDILLPLLLGLPKHVGIVPIQVLGELFNVLTRKAGRSRADARQVVLAWHDAFEVVETTFKIMVAATDLANDHQLAIWDAVILAAASNAGCRLLLSEDLHDGFTWGGTTVANPFARPNQSLLEAFLRGSS
ncbi:MAG: PIN domain-containing protein [Rhizobium sp.]|nr:PIN domain-containing protein [Rhizobium sp.]